MEKLKSFENEKDLQKYLKDHETNRIESLNMRFKLKNDTPFDFHDIVFGWEFWGGGGELGIGYRCYRYDTLIKDFAVEKYVKIASCVFYYEGHDGVSRSFRCKNIVAQQGRYLHIASWRVIPKTDKGELTGEIDIVLFDEKNSDEMK